MAGGGARGAGLAFALASVAAASGAWLPSAGASRPSASCDFGPRTTIKRLAGPPASPLRSVLGVLRRPARASDRLPRVPGQPSSSLHGPGRPVTVAYIRLVGVLPDASHIFVIPG